MKSVLFKEPEQKYKACMGNLSRRTDGEITTTSEDAKEVKKSRGMLEWKKKQKKTMDNLKR